MKKLEGLLMVSGQVILCTLVGTELVHTRLKTSKHLLNRLAWLLREIFILTPVSLKQPSLYRSYPLMVLREGSPDLMRHLKVLDALVLGCAKG